MDKKSAEARVILKAFGLRLRQLRELAGMGQEQLAAYAGVSVSALREWEQGRNVIGLLVLHALADALGVAPVRLLDPVDPRLPTTPQVPGRPKKQAIQVEQTPPPTGKPRGRPRKQKEG